MNKKLSKHQIVQKFCEGLNKNLASSFLLVGSAGLGKTESVLLSLRNLGLKENEHFKYLNSYSSPLEFYHLLEEVNELESPKLLVLDDSEEYITNKRILSLLRSSLWGNLEGKRIVNWNSPRAKNKSFEFTGKVIILLNELNLSNNLIRALVSRGFFYNLDLTNKEKITLMRERVKEPYKNLSLKTKNKIVDFIAEKGLYSDKLNLRILIQSYNLHILSPNSYQTLILELLKS